MFQGLIETIMLKRFFPLVELKVQCSVVFLKVSEGKLLVYVRNLWLYITEFLHLFKQSKTEPAVLFVSQDLKSKISEKSDKN